ncbi:hypothetical protein ACMU_11495 [Actibacterium mucosum KCTC 23349]|uniref:Uncharacterized protein n=1 Tax=Actibacterium mucosum KCTC 23349 TaxID=1454373 RepID=A0A037ZFR0_9RHOB|nr:hypothetical protein [Actibacterium mucosum]KAJ55315.1 hypothetical protein ACMU_11495 [Actibacterium mucosum KCTC 23349]
MPEPIARVAPSIGRRVFGIGTLALLGAICLILALGRDHSSVGFQALILAIGLGALAMAEWMRRATAAALILTDEGISLENGALLVPMDDVTRIDRGMFAMKPSNGFVLTLSTGIGRNWAPGLWWSMGRRFGVGGVTSAGQTKFMAEAISAVLAQRPAR